MNGLYRKPQRTIRNKQVENSSKIPVPAVLVWCTVQQSTREPAE